MTATELFESTMEWLRAHFGDVQFSVERDVVWTIQRRLAQLIAQQELPYRVFNDYPMLPGPYRAQCADIVVLPEPITLPKQSPTGKWSESMPVAAAVEVKYEPAHTRWGKDIWPTKGQVVDWADIGNDVARVNDFVAKERAEVAFAILIDEGGAFRQRAALAPGAWLDWPNGVSVHWTRVDASPPQTDRQVLLPSLPTCMRVSQDTAAALVWTAVACA